MESSTTHLKLPTGGGLRRYLGTRNGTIAVAVVVAGAALAVLLSFMSNYRQSVAAQAAGATALVAKRAIDKGTSGDLVAERMLVEPKQFSEEQIGPQTLAHTGLLRGTTAVRDIYPGQQLTASDFVPGADPITTRISGEERAVSIPVDGAHGNVGQITAGSHVDVLGSPKEESGNVTAKAPPIFVLARDILVLKAPGADGGPTGGTSNNNVVLRLQNRQVRRVVVMADKGTVWLLIRPPTVAKELKLGRLWRG